MSRVFNLLNYLIKTAAKEQIDIPQSPPMDWNEVPGSTDAEKLDYLQKEFADLFKDSPNPTLEIYQANSNTYLSAWCQTSKGDRTFRFDRILSIENSANDVMVVNSSEAEKKDSALNIELFIAKSARNFIEENSSIIESTAEGDGFRVKLHPIDLDWLARTILGFGSGIEVISPTILAVQVKERAQAIKVAYQGSQ